MKYLMLVCWDTERMDAQVEPEASAAEEAEEAEEDEEESFPWLDDLQARGIWVMGDQLAPPRRARTVRVRDGKQLVSDGPFADTKEAVGGWFVLEADDLDAALEVAARVPAARHGGAIEIRPVEKYW